MTEPGRLGTPARSGASRHYVTLLGLTLLNPATVVYLAALVVGGGGRSDPRSALLSGVLIAALALWTVTGSSSASGG